MKITYWDVMNWKMCYVFFSSSFELSDVAFCILSRYNRTLFHLSRQYSCSCSIHYFNRNSSHVPRYPSNYLRVTPFCQSNESHSMLSIRMLENQCDYRLTFLDCDAMTTTTTATEHTSTQFNIKQLDTSIRLTTSILISSSPSK